MFQEMYYYKGFTHARTGEIKFLAFNSVNPIQVSIPRLIYDEVLRFVEKRDNRNKRLLNLYEPRHMRESKGFSAINLMNLSLGEVELCFREDPLFSGVLLTHWITRNPYTARFSTESYINLPPVKCDERFNFSKKFDAVQALQEMFIPKALAPTIVPIVNSLSYHDEQELIANNKFQKFIL